MVYLVRHGESVFNQLDLYQGHAANNSLTEKGVGQAYEAATLLRHLNGNAAIYTSPLLRTYQTAEIIADCLGKSFKVEERLTEYMRSKKFENWPGKKMYCHPDYISWKRHTDELDYTFTLEDGESIQRYCKRLEAGFKRLEENGKDLILVLHRSGLDYLIHYLTGLLRNYFFDNRPELKPGCVVKVDGQNWQILSSEVKIEAQ